MFTYLSKDIQITKLGKNDIERKMRVVVSRPIRDYGVVMHGYKLIYMTVLDIDGRIYRGKIDFHELNQAINDFSNKIISMKYEDRITSICCYTSFVICAQKNGNLLLLNFNEDNTLVDEPISIALIDSIKKHQVAQ